MILTDPGHQRSGTLLQWFVVVVLQILEDLLHAGLPNFPCDIFFYQFCTLKVLVSNPLFSYCINSSWLLRRHEAVLNTRCPIQDHFLNPQQACTLLCRGNSSYVALICLTTMRIELGSSTLPSRSCSSSEIRFGIKNETMLDLFIHI